MMFENIFFAVFIFALLIGFLFSNKKNNPYKFEEINEIKMYVYNLKGWPK